MLLLPFQDPQHLLFLTQIIVLPFHPPLQDLQPTIPPQQELYLHQHQHPCHKQHYFNLQSHYSPDHCGQQEDPLQMIGTLTFLLLLDGDWTQSSRHLDPRFLMAPILIQIVIKVRTVINLKQELLRRWPPIVKLRVFSQVLVYSWITP